jgi:hypothetical protein
MNQTDCNSPMTDEETPFEPLEESDELTLLRAFAGHGVRMIVSGSYALRVHCNNLRAPGDLDLVVEPEPANLDRMQAALESLGVAEAVAVRELFARPQPALWHWREGLLDHHVDLVSAARSFSFAELARDAVAVTYAEFQLLVICRDHLVASKRTALMDPNRADDKKAQDQIDLEALLAPGAPAPTESSGQP